jgi:hypothetical protein
MEFVPLLLPNKAVSLAILESSAIDSVPTDCLEVEVPLGILRDVNGPTGVERAVLGSVPIRLGDRVPGAAVVDVALGILKIPGSKDGRPIERLLSRRGA